MEVRNTMKIYKRSLSLLLVFVLFVSMFSFLTACSNEEKLDEEDTNVSYVSMDYDISDVKIIDEESALKAVESIAESLGISDVNKELKIEKVNEFNDEKFYRMQQYYNDIPVYGKDIVLAVGNEGVANTVTTNITQITSHVNTEALISQGDLEEIITSYLTKELKEDEDFYYTIPKLEDNQQYIYETEKGEYVLVYLVKTGFYDFIVDARECVILDYIYTLSNDTSITCYNGDGSEEFEGYYSEMENIYCAYNEQRKLYVFTYKKTNSKSKNSDREYLTSKDSYFGNSSDSNEVENEYGKGVTFINNISDIYDYFYDTFGETAYGEFQIHYNDGFSWGRNALGGSRSTVDGKTIGYMSMGYKTGVTDIDVMVHEFTHIISRYHVGWTGGKENGAINEGYSDIFGEIVESKIKGTEPDWMMKGDNISVNRNIASPSNTKYPENISDKNRSGEDYSHAYSTVISHAAYLMWNGIDGNDSMKIDIDTLAKIWYRALLLMHSNVDFEQCANKVLQSAKTLKGLTDEQIDCVKKAFEKVGIIVSADASSSIYRSSSLYVKDINFKNYGNYHLKIFSLQDLRNPKLVLEQDITDASGYSLDLEEGTYAVNVTDNDENGSKDEYVQTIRILDSGIRQFNNPVSIYTNFGGIFAGDFTIPNESVITLGELSVIEPEITPADATSYSIKWSSSDESVATVSPNGEAGIITTLAKGTTTITAELISGGKTITKTTNLRVASKARDTVLVLDVSGSMYGEPLDEMKKSAIQFCNDLLKDEYNNRVGIVFYDDGISTIALTDDLNMLISRIQSISDGGRTNMEAGLSASDKMLKNSGKADSIKNVVVMADGLPNEGKTSYSGSMPSENYSGYYTSVSYANAVIDTAKQMMNNYNLYSLGFFHGLYSDEKDFATTLMKELTNQADGYHQVDKAEELQFAFGDISEDINVGSKIVINIACPVDVTIRHKGETLSSASENYNDKTSFGTLQLLGSNLDIKVLTLEPDVEYDVELTGTGEGQMNYSVNYLDENEEMEDSREFVAVPITSRTKITTNTSAESENMDLNIDKDGDGEVDTIWSATKEKKGAITYEREPEPAEDEEAVAVPEKKPEPSPQKPSFEIETWKVALIAIGVFAFAGIAVAVVLVCMPKSEHWNEEVEEQQEEEQNQEEQPTEDKELVFEPSISILNGPLAGAEIPIRDKDIIYIGKDSKIANIVFAGDYPLISRLHCSVMYDSKYNKYFVTDSSTNGIYYLNGTKLEKGKRTAVEPGTVLVLANEKAKIMLR